MAFIRSVKIRSSAGQTQEKPRIVGSYQKLEKIKQSL